MRTDETSTETQTHSIEQWCSMHSAELVEVVEDKGRSAFKDEQRYLIESRRRALQLLRSGAITTVACWKVDRIARNARDLLNFVHEIEELGGTFVSVSEQFDTSKAMGRAMLTIVGALAELESANKSERISVWQNHRRNTRATPTGPRPFGYERTRNELHVKADEAKTVQSMAQRVLKGESLRSITKTVPLTQRAVRRILTSPTTAALREIEGQFIDCSDVWKPLLDRKTFDKMRELLLDPERTLNPGGGRRHLLSGLLECGKGDCDGRFRIKTTHPKGLRYECAKCSQSVPQADVDELIETAVKSQLDLKAWAKMRRQGGTQFDTKQLESDLAELLRMFDADEIGLTEYKSMRAKLVHDLKSVAEQPLDLPNVKDPRKEWATLDIDARRLLVTAVMPRIVVNAATPGLSRFDDSRIVPMIKLHAVS
jgi:DNA invertase Pin-like site-specific DNA recombinase